MLSDREDATLILLFNNTRLEGLEGYETKLEPGIWIHYCLVMTSRSYSFYLSGVLALSGAHSFPIQDLDLNGILVLGQEQDNFGGGFVQHETFRGNLAQVDIFSRGLTEAEVESLAKCRAEMHGDVFSLDLDSMENSSVSVESMALEELCEEHPQYVIYTEPLKFQDSEGFCAKTGGFLYTPSSCQAARVLYNRSLEFQSVCPNSFWVGLSDEEEEGVWRESGSKREAANCFGFPPNGKESENCASIRMETGLWDDRSCQHPFRCFSCLSQQPLVLRGYCFKTLQRTHFQVLGYKNRKPFFHGYFGLVIYRERDGRWQLMDTQENLTLATVSSTPEHEYPIGRLLWTTDTKVCSHRAHQQIELSLSVCNSSQIVCSDGHCVPSSARCDGRYQCPDLSDENGCRVIRFPEGYRTQLAPEPHNPSSPEPVNVSLSFLRFLSIQDTKYSVTMEFILTTSWKDRRLAYLNLREDSSANKASEEEAQRLWRPSVKYMNVLDGNVRVVDKEVLVERAGDPQERDFNQVSIDSVFDGASGVLMETQHISGVFECSFNLYQYPFDSQRCSVDLRFGRDLGDYLTVNEEGTKVLYLGSYALPSHVVHDFSVKGRKSTQGTNLEIYFTLSRRPKFLVIKLFIPSLMLLTVGYVTLYIPRAQIQARLVLSLTTKLVLYTLFNQASSSLPDTAYVKLIDIWFFFCICTLFFIIVFHVFVGYLPEGKERILQVTTRRGKPPKLTADGAVRGVRYLFIPCTTAVFLVVYWTTMAS